MLFITHHYISNLTSVHIHSLVHHLRPSNDGSDEILAGQDLANRPAPFPVSAERLRLHANESLFRASFRWCRRPNLGRLCPHTNAEHDVLPPAMPCQLQHGGAAEHKIASAWWRLPNTKLRRVGLGSLIGIIRQNTGKVARFGPSLWNSPARGAMYTVTPSPSPVLT